MVEGGAAAAPGSDPIAVIRRALMDSKTQLSTVNSVLTGFKCGLDRLEGQMMPIYNLTEKLRETQKNIDLSVHELRAVNETFATATEVATTLHQGAKYDQAEYFKAMHRLLESISFMESHRGYEGCGKALEQARHVLNQAQVKCKSDIVNDIGLFCRYAMTLPVSSDPDDNDPSIDQGKAQQEPVVTASQPSDADVAKVNALVQCLLDTGLVPRQLLVEYGEKRLKHIKDFFKDANAATPPADISTAQHMKETIGRYLDMVVYVIKMEKGLATKVFATEDLSHAALSYTIAPLLETLTHDVKRGTPHRNDVFRPLDLHYLFKAKSAAFQDALQPPLRLREHPGVETADPWKLVGIVAKMEEELAVAAKSTLSQFKTDIGDALMQDKQLGRFRDGNVHPVSSNVRRLRFTICDTDIYDAGSGQVMQFVRHLCDHVVELECLLKSDQTTNVAYFVGTSSQLHCIVHMGVLTLSQIENAQFIDVQCGCWRDSIVMKLIESLKASNVIKGGREDLRTLFTLNNVMYISQSLKQLGQDLHTPAQAVVTAALQQTIQPKVAALGDKAIQDFMHLRWEYTNKLVDNRLSSYDEFDAILADPTTKLQYNRNSDVLTLDSGRLVKEKFTKSYTVPDADLRKTLMASALQRIVPSYTVFYDKYSVVHFSKKHMDKYVKYTPANVDAMLHELFQGLHHPSTSSHASSS
ncbi:hypothetical protein AaE_012094 [Aphanomyces astaci]|uniref:Exocyst subunit Exo70 family protein n=1 Tax=Aphanomyces astaci TaxID=112090 RepID=A0A6A4ZIX2_APHAT|nr:hypothetical protein AaE_012094 [Aphanomyces astaci]